MSGIYLGCAGSNARSSPQEADLALDPPLLNDDPGDEYSDEVRDYAMVIGADRTLRGRIWAAWVAGGDSDLGYFVLASSDDNGRSWSKPRLVIDPTDTDIGLRRRTLVGNLWTDPTGSLWLFFDQSLGYFDGRAGLWATTCVNPDDARPVWSVPQRIWHGCTLNKPTMLSTGEWLLPVSLWDRRMIKPSVLADWFRDLDDMRMAHVFVSTDAGQTWNRRGGVRFEHNQFDEHMIIEMKDGRLWMLARTTYGIAESYSFDRGLTWTEGQPSPIRHVSSRFFLRRLASGNILLIKHGAVDQRIETRSHLMAFLSDNEGQTWQGGLLIDERAEVSYPDGFQSPDGLITVVYDHNRALDREILMSQFREDDIMATRFQSPDACQRLLVSKALG